MIPEKFIALEIHDVSLWEPSRVLPIVDTMEEWGYNALVLHQNDLLDTSTQIGLAANYGVSDLRLKKVRNNTAWLNRLTHRLSEFDAQLFLEIKEPSYHDYVLEFYPDLLGADGYPNPMSPLWVDFCRRKTEDLLHRVPDIGGLVVNLSSPESRVSLPDYLATHEESGDQEDWFKKMISAFQSPLGDKGKSLFVRDFSYTSDMQSDVLRAIDSFDGAVGASVKITAHDYFPQYPENPAASMVSAPLVFEFEAFGEHMGWGVIPNCRVAEFCERMVGYRRLGAIGFLMRTSWEAMSGTDALDTLSAVNVYALPKLMDGHVPSDTLIKDWLADAHGVVGETAHKASKLLSDSWHIPAAAYWSGLVFPRHSCLPSTWKEGWLSLKTNGMGSRDQNPVINSDDALLTEAARLRLFSEKETASDLADNLSKEARALGPELPPELATQFEAFDWMPVFAKQFELATKATFFAARALPADLEKIPALRFELLALADDLDRRLHCDPDAPHRRAVLLDPMQIRRFVDSLPA